MKSVDMNPATSTFQAEDWTESYQGLFHLDIGAECLGFKWSFLPSELRFLLLQLLGAQGIMLANLTSILLHMMIA